MLANIGASSIRKDSVSTCWHGGAASAVARFAPNPPNPPPAHLNYQDPAGGAAKKFIRCCQKTCLIAT